MSDIKVLRSCSFFRCRYFCNIRPTNFFWLRIFLLLFRISLPAERSFPITQSYVDIIMRGCLSISHDFARRFLRTTHGWWIDDHVPSTQNNVDECGVERAATKEVPSDIVIVIDRLGEGDDGQRRRRMNGLAEEEEEDGRCHHHTWVNDRHAPMYVRADSEYSLENGRVIDELIGEHHPHALLRRVDLRYK